MKSKNCPQRIGRPPIDSRTTQAFRHLRLHAEELALELTVRLRVLGKSLSAACPGSRTEVGRMRSSASYVSIRRQLDGFFCTLVDGDFDGQHYFPVVREYIQEILPFELNGCVGDDPCRIELVEALISLLSESAYEDNAFTGALAPSYSL